MDGAVLADDGAGVDGQDVVVGEGGGEDAGCLVVFRRLVVGGQDDASVDDEEVGVGGWQAVAVGLVDGVGQGEPVQSVGLAVGSLEGLHLLLEGLEVGIVLIGGIVAIGVEQGVVGRHTDDGVDVAVGVVAAEVAVVDPDDALGAEAFFQFFLYLLARAWLVAPHLALGGGHDGSTSVALDGSSLEHEVGVLLQSMGEVAFFVEVEGDEVVVVGGELAAPAVELELQGDGLCASLGGLEIVLGEG